MHKLGERKRRKMARDEKSEVKKLFEQYVCASFCFFSFFSSVHKGAMCRKKKERWQWIRSSDRNFSKRWNNAGSRKSWLKKRWKGKRWRRWKRNTYLEYELQLLNFITVRGVNARHIFTSNPPSWARVKEVFLTCISSRILLPTKLLFPEYFAKGLTSACWQFAFLEEETFTAR